jgi:hypothetical protein
MSEFSEIWVVTFGARWLVGEGWRPSFLAARELSSQRAVALDEIALLATVSAPYPTHENALLVGFTAEALVGCHIFLKWPMPSQILDLQVEFRNLTSGRSRPCGKGLAGALVQFGLPASDAIGPGRTVDDCGREVTALQQLFLAMQGHLDLPRALLRGRYLMAVGRIEAAGIPVDHATLEALKRRWEDIVRELGTAVVDAKPDALAIGADGRHRSELRPFSSRTGRNQPSGTQFILAGPGWLRRLIRPEPGRGLAVIDWEQQEFGIAAALSGDQRMMADYQTGDAYLAFANRYGIFAASSSGRQQREVFKACALGILNGIGSSGLACQIGCSLPDALFLLQQHRTGYPQFWRWSDGSEMNALLHGRFQSVFGWGVAVTAESNPRFLRNFPMQANGAEMLRLACCLATENGVVVCSLHHDALLIEAPREDLADAIKRTEAAMAEASEVVLDRFPLRTSAKSFRYPDYYPCPQGDALWSKINRALGQFEENSEPARGRNTPCMRVRPRPISSYVYNRRGQSDARD